MTAGSGAGDQQQGISQQTPPRGPTRKEAAAVHDPFAALTGEKCCLHSTANASWSNALSLAGYLLLALTSLDSFGGVSNTPLDVAVPFVCHSISFCQWELCLPQQA